MLTKAVRLYGASDLRLEEFDLGEIHDDEILVEVISDSVCMSTHKCAILGQQHKRVPMDVLHNPTIMGHEMAGNIVQVGAKYQGQFREGDKFTMQPALNYKGSMWSPGYSYGRCGGNATYCVMPPEVMECGCFLTYRGEAYFEASLAEPMSCCIGAFHAAYHTQMGVYSHSMGIKEGGRLAILAGAGPMGMGAVEYALGCDRRPAAVVVTDIDQARLEQCRQIFSAKGEKTGIALHFVNTAGMENPAKELKNLVGGGFDDVFIFAPVSALVELGSGILGRDGCINFFAGPTDTQLMGKINCYDLHYNSAHVMGTTGGNTEDMKESLTLSEQGRINPAVMVTHIGGLDCAAQTILDLPKLSGGKKLIYNHISMPLTALSDFRSLSGEDSRFAALADILDSSNGLWCPEAERYLLSHWR